MTVSKPAHGIRALAGRRLLPLLLLAFPIQSLAQEPPREMGFAEALAWAVEHAGLIQAARAGTEALEAKLRQAEWTAWPHLSLTSVATAIPSQHGPDGNSDTQYDEWGPFFQVELTGWVPLFTFNKIKHLKTAAGLGVDVGRASERIAEAEVRFRLLRGFFALSFARELSSVVEEGRGYMNKARRHVEEMEKAEDPSLDPVDKLKVRVADAQVRAKDLEARRALALAEAGIRVAAGMAVDADVRLKVGAPEPVRPLVELDLAALEAKAVAGRPELIALRTGIAARQAEVRARRVAFWPDLLLAGSAKYAVSENVWFRPDVDDPTNEYTGRLGLLLRWDFEIGRKLGELREAEANLAKLEAEGAEAERAVRLEVGKLYREAVDAREMVEAQKDAMEAARGWVISKTDLYENDLAEMTDVLNGLVQFFTSRMDYLKAIHDWNVALAALERACGVALVPDTF